MKRKYKIVLITLSIFLILFIVLYVCIGTKGIGLIIDKLGITKNTFEINVDESINEDLLYIYWFGEIGGTIERNKLMIYNRGELELDIPPSYGKNWFLIKYKNINYERIGFFKLESYSKHNYNFKFKQDTNSFIISWEVNNWYDSDVYQGVDTLKLN